MNFTSPAFFAFFAVVMALYYLPLFKGKQIWVLILASVFFYAYEKPTLLILLFASCAVSTASSYGLLKSQSRRAQIAIAGSGVGFNLLLLGFFKYKFLFISRQFSIEAPDSGDILDTLLALPLPIGISFYTFHGISLLIDAFRRRDGFFLKYNAGLFSHSRNTFLYLVFFPQLIAGPIVKAKDFFPQIGSKRPSDIDTEFVVKSLIIGFFLKSVIADNLKDQTFFIQSPYFLANSSINLFALLFGYSMQIFADFAGYSLIALGLAGLLGYRLPNNFNFPYISQSISDFWRRWHISLSSWLRDYLYIPLGGSLHGKVRTYLNLIIVMFFGGLWHGAAWSYAIWGLWHGVGLALERPFLETRFYTSENKIIAAIRIVGVLIFVTLGWLLFKLPNFSDAISYVLAMHHNSGLPLNVFPILIISLYSIPVLAYHGLYLAKPRQMNLFTPYILAAMLFLVITNSGRKAAFIYFQF